MLWIARITVTLALLFSLLMGCRPSSCPSRLRLPLDSALT